MGRIPRPWDCSPGPTFTVSHGLEMGEEKSELFVKHLGTAHTIFFWGGLRAISMEHAWHTILGGKLLGISTEYVWRRCTGLRENRSNIPTALIPIVACILLRQRYVALVLIDKTCF